MSVDQTFFASKFETTKKETKIPYETRISLLKSSDYVKEKAYEKLKEINIKPEIETFDLGNMWFGAQLVKEGVLKDHPLFQICLGIPWGAPATL